MPVPALRIPLSLNMDEFQKNLDSARSLTSTTTQFIVKRFIDVNATVIASGGAAGTAVLGFRSLLGVLGPLGIAIGGVAAVFQLMGYATELAKEKIEEFNTIAENAARANVSTDFFQRMGKAAEQTKSNVDDLTDALEHFASVSKDRLGGSDLQREIAKLSGYGNFGGNSGVGAVSGATGTEAQLRATVNLLNQAFDSGQRLAALDIAEKAFGPKIADNLRQDSNYLQQMLDTADKIRAEKIISDDQIGQAIELKTRLDEAQKVLSEKFKPIQDDLAKLGVNYHESWIGIVETLAEAVNYATQLYDAIKRIPDVMAEIGSAPFWKQFTEFTGKLGLNSDPKSLGMIFPGEAGFSTNTELAALLKNPAAVRRAMQSATEVQSAVRGDTSKAPPEKAAPEEARDQFEISIDSINKHIATLNADTAAMFSNNAARVQLRAEFQALTAIMRDGGEVTQEQIDKYEKLRQTMSAQQALTQAGIVLTKEHSDAFLAASQNIRSAADSYDSAQLKLQRLNSASASFGSALETAFADAVVEGKNFGDVLTSLEKQLAKMAINSLFGSFFNAPGTGGLSPFASLVNSIIPGFAGGTDSAPGGLAWVGEHGPELMNVPKGAQILPADISRQVASGSTLQITNMVSGDVSLATIQRLQQAQIATLRKFAQIDKLLVSTQRMQATGVG